MRSRATPQRTAARGPLPPSCKVFTCTNELGSQRATLNDTAFMNSSKVTGGAVMHVSAVPLDHDNACVRVCVRACVLACVRAC
eukprot:14492289-Alexandrium_andersonii.AAC.1